MNFRVALIVQASLALTAPTLDLLKDCLYTASVPIASSLPTSYNVRLPYKPLAVAIPTTVSQISSAVSCGAQNGISISAKSGGHSYTSSGFGGEDGHLVINLDRMNTVTLASDGTARVQAGTRLGHITTELFNQGKRAISHGTCPGVGIGGHALHGGHGMVARMYGLATDWVIGATVVLANGTITRCSATERPNLFWAIRGAGSSMAIVAELEFNTFAAPEEMTTFDIELDWDASKAPQVLLEAQEFAKTMPEELTMQVTINNDGYYLNGAYVGNDAAFLRTVQPLLTKLGAKAISRTEGWMDFIRRYSGTEEIDITTPDYNEHENFYATSISTHALPKTTYESLVDVVDKTGVGSGRTWFLHINFHGGAISRVQSNDTAYAHRDRMLLFQLKDSVPTDQQYPRDGLVFLQGLKQSVSKGLQSGDWGMYASYPDSELVGSDAPSLYWGSNLRRLEWVKEDYDPGNIFRDPQSIKPAE